MQVTNVDASRLRGSLRVASGIHSATVSTSGG
jgi:hypothetical protein